jgi:hypothetical protein
MGLMFVRNLHYSKSAPRQRLSDAYEALDKLINEINMITDVVTGNDRQIVELQERADQEAERFDLADSRVRNLEIERELLSK